MRQGIAIITITKNGAELGYNLGGLLPDSHLYLPAKFATGKVPEVRPFQEPIADVVEEVFGKYQNIVLIMATGIAVRLLAPHIEDKRKDPAVVVMDAKGEYAISLLSGHVGGANALTRKIASVTGARPIITTASDLYGTIAVDLLGRELGWQIDNEANVTRVSAALVNGEDVGIYQDVGERGWKLEHEPLPHNIHFFNDLEALQKSSCTAALIITDRELNKKYKSLLERSIIYRPRSLVVGIGCHRDIRSSQIGAAIKQVFEEQRLAIKSIKNIATIDIKRHEQGLLDFAQKHGLPIDFFPKEALKQAKYPSNASTFVFNSVGIPAVCEPAALLSSDNGYLVVPKMKIKNIAIAIARISYEENY